MSTIKISGIVNALAVLQCPIMAQAEWDPTEYASCPRILKEKGANKSAPKDTSVTAPKAASVKAPKAKAVKAPKEKVAKAPKEKSEGPKSSKGTKGS